MIRSLLASAGSLALIATPTLAAAAPTSSAPSAKALSLAGSPRAGTASRNSSKIAGIGGAGLVIVALTAAAVITGIVLAVDDDDSPDSP